MKQAKYFGTLEERLHYKEVRLHYKEVRLHSGLRGGGGVLGYFLGGYVLPGTPNWHPILEKIYPKIDTPF